MPEAIARTATGGPYTLFSGKVRTLNSTPFKVLLWPRLESPLRISGALYLEVEALGFDENSGESVRFLIQAAFRRAANALECASYSAQVSPGTGAWSVIIGTDGSHIFAGISGGSDPVSWLVNVRASLAQKET